jgi:hypothetical protein
VHQGSGLQGVGGLLPPHELAGQGAQFSVDQTEEFVGLRTVGEVQVPEQQGHSRIGGIHGVDDSGDGGGADPLTRADQLTGSI